MLFSILNYIAYRSSVSIQFQLVSTNINSESSRLSFPNKKSHLFKWLFKKNGFLAVCDTTSCQLCEADLEVKAHNNKVEQTLWGRKARKSVSVYFYQNDKVILKL